VAGGASAGSSRAFRLDPFALPIRYTAVIGGVSGGRASILLNREDVIIARPWLGGSLASVTLPVAAYAGVAVRIVPVGDGGGIGAVVELMHDEPGLSLPLVIADEPEDVAADWQAWARILNLPLLVVANDGTVVKANQRVGGLTIGVPKARRRHSYFAARRPRFLTRRKTGRRGAGEVIVAREIIARD
jgi:hypothetical protein